MAATRENVLAAIVDYVEQNKRRAPAKVIAEMVGDTVPNVQAIVKGLVSDGQITSSRGRNGGALPPGVTLPARAAQAKVARSIKKADPQPAGDNDGEVSAGGNSADDDAVADQFAALMEQLGGDEAHA